MSQRKRLFTLDLHGEYSPAIKSLTFPLFQHYAKKIGSTFEVITEDKFPGWPYRTNKFQVYDLIKGEPDTWAIFYDADTLVHPDMVDVTELISKDTVLHNASDFAGIRWNIDAFFRRDGRNLGSCSWYQVAHSWCRDFFTPPNQQVDEIDGHLMTLEEVVSRINPTQNEAFHGMQPDHLIDDFTFSRNIARFGLKFTSIQKLSGRIMCPLSYHWHQYLLTESEKVDRMKEVIHLWQLDGPGNCGKPTCQRCNPQPQTMGR